MKQGPFHHNFIPAVAVVIALSGLAGCSKKAAETKDPPARITNVEIYPVEPVKFEDYINLPVVVKPNREVDLGLTTGGKVTKIHADKGDRVEKGMVLLETDDVMLRANLEIAEANLEYQKKEFARSGKLFQEGSITAAAYDGAKLQLAQARHSYEIARKQYEDSVLKAPFSGIVTRRNVEVGDILGPGTPAFRIIDMSRVKVQAGIPEKYIEDFRIGNTVAVRFDAIPGKTFKGRINYISPEADTTVRTFLAEIVVDNPDGLLRAGIMGDARILRKVHENALMIPINAVVETQEGRIVFVVRDDGTAERRSVELGGVTDLTVCVVSGLEENDRVIVKGQHDLVTGEKVNITGEYSIEPGEVSGE